MFPIRSTTKGEVEVLHLDRVATGGYARENVLVATDRGEGRIVLDPAQHVRYKLLAETLLEKLSQSGARTVSGSEVVLNPVSAAKTTPRSCVLTCPVRDQATFIAIRQWTFPAGAIVRTSPRINSRRRPSSGGPQQLFRGDRSLPYGHANTSPILSEAILASSALRGWIRKYPPQA
jgi:hypothetical protein